MEISSDIQQLTDRLNGAGQKVVIVTHKNPDGDAIGSALGLGLYLIKKGHDAKVVIPNRIPNYLTWFPHSDLIFDAEAQPDYVRQLINEAHLIFALDFGVLDRIDQVAPIVRQAKALKINIDHHLEPESFADFVFRDVKASSTCELVFRFIEHMNDLNVLYPTLATCLYTGIVTDTSSFRYRSASDRTLTAAAQLLKAGADNEFINYKIYNNQTLNRTRFVGHVFTSCLELVPELNFGYIKISLQTYNDFNLQPGDTEGIVNFPLTIEGIHLSVMMTQTEEMIRMSFRSIGSFPANKLAGHFGGGGHYNAAGGRSFLSLEATEAELLRVVREEYGPLLQYEPFSEVQLL